MRLKELQIEGFKSYSQKTVIKNFDPHFNAITGLNGSGKSNILDSLIFLLGITGYKDLRASDSKDLIYKQGSAGITTATVTGIFDNSDPNRSPVGYQHNKTITVQRSINTSGGPSKYTVNGTKMTQAKVQELFQSVQLNVLNPHFIIMQGRIAKVCNMKPAELLKLLEEATGTSLFDSRRDKALATLEKKEQVLAASRELLDTLHNRQESLGYEVQKYNEYQSISQEIIKGQSWLAAFEYVDKVQDVERLKETNISLETTSIQLKNEQEDLIQTLSLLKTQSKDNGPYQVALQSYKNEKEHVGTLTKDIVSLQESLQHNVRQSKILNDKMLALDDTIKQLTIQSTTIDQRISNATNATNTAKQAHIDAQSLLDSVQSTLTGITNNNNNTNGNGGGGNLNDRQMALQDELSRLSDDLNRIRMQTNEANERIKSTIDRQHTEQRNYNTLSSQCEQLKNKISNDNNNLLLRIQDVARQQQLGDINDIEQGIHIISHQYESMQKQQQKLQHEMIQIKSNIQQNDTIPDHLHNRIYPHLNLQNIDPSTVYGTLAKLIKVTNTRYCTALEIAGGSRMFNIVVRDNDIGRRLLEAHRGRGQRLNILPLNTIRGFTLSQQDITMIKNKVKSRFNERGNELFIATEIIEHSDEAKEKRYQLGPAIDFIFGQVFVCRDNDIADYITKEFRNKNPRVVTIDGSVYESSGAMTGGALTHGSTGFLRSLSFDPTSNPQYMICSKALDNIHTTITLYGSLMNDIRQHNDTKEDLQQITQRMERSPYTRLQNIVDEQNKLIASLQQQNDDITNKIGTTKTQLEHLKATIESLNNNNDKKATEKRIAQLRKDIIKYRDDYMNKQSQLHKITLEQESLQQDLQQAKDEYDTIMHKLEDTKHNHTVCARSLTEKREQLIDAEQSAAQAQSELAIIEERMKSITDRISEIDQQVHFKKNQLDDTLHGIKANKDIIKQLENKIKQTERDNKWIVQTKELFNKSPDWMFINKDINQARKDLEHKRHLQDELRKYNNPNIPPEYERLQNDYMDRMNKFESVQADKRSIIASIESLNLKRLELSESTFTNTNKYFSAIFSILLPGAQSRLVAHRHGNDLVGVSMQVGFNDHWKDSLSELSGGQRSLLALSLILGLLRCKPAPLYILDEVDAALDASHTQNIGTIIKDFFTQSQFIIVSLKEGMFENANMLVRTQLGNNGSGVTIARRSSSHNE